MKKFITPIPDGGAPMHSNDVLDPIFKDIYTSLESSLYGISAETQGVIVRGCVVTPNGGNFDCTSGVVYLNGQFMDFPGFTNQPATRYIVPASAVNSSFPFFDGGTKNLIVTQSATHQGSAPGSGQYISVSNTTPRSLLNYVSPQVSTLIGAKVAKSGDTMSGNLAMGSNKVTGLAASTANGDAVRYEQLDEFVVKANGSTTVGLGATTVITLPSSSNTNFKVKARVVAKYAGTGGVAGDGGIMERVFAFKNVAGSVASLGSAVTVYSISNVGSAPDVIATISGTDILIQIKNASSGPIYDCKVTASIEAI